MNQRKLEDWAWSMATLAREDRTIIPHDGPSSPVPEMAAAIVKTKESWDGGQTKTKAMERLLTGLKNLDRVTQQERETLRVAWLVKTGWLGARPLSSLAPEIKKELVGWMI